MKAVFGIGAVVAALLLALVGESVLNSEKPDFETLTKGNTAEKAKNRFLPFILPRRSVNYSPVIHRASLSGTFLPNLPDLVTPLKGHSLSPRSCPATRSAPAESFGY